MTQEVSKNIDEFISRYSKEYDFYEQSARLVTQLLDKELESTGIPAIVTFRAKSPKRLKKKLEDRSEDKDYKTIDDIYKDIVDLAGVRVALYFPAQRKQLEKLIRQHFHVIGNPKEFPEPKESKESPTTKKLSDTNYKKRFSGYWATHYRVRLCEESLNEASKRYAEALVEIQVGSVLMHAWAEVEHDLVYKPRGNLSEDEHAILDELNGLVIAGEIALERLQKAGTGKKFSNHYFLAAFLLEEASNFLQNPAIEATLGKVDLLYLFLCELDLTKPELDLTDPKKLGLYIKSLSDNTKLPDNTELRPLSEQIIDKLLEGGQEYYDAYDRARSKFDLKSRSQILGEFLSEWIKFEQMSIKKREQLEPEEKPALRGSPFTNLESFVPKDYIPEINKIRRLRNNLVHGVETHDTRDIDEATRRLKEIVNAIKPASATL